MAEKQKRRRVLRDYIVFPDGTKYEKTIPAELVEEWMVESGWVE